MKIKDIMSCSYLTCASKDLLSSVATKMVHHNANYVLVVEENDKYVGVLTAASLLGSKPGSKVETLIQHIQAVDENDNINELQYVDKDIVPVLNTRHNVVGIVNLRSILEYLPETFSFDSKRLNEVNAGSINNSKYTIDDIVGQGPRILQLKERIIAAAKSKSTVLIQGETGTGKELVAHAIHKLSSRRHQPFIRINCAAIPENLLESELFGYEQGAFTGAVKGGHPGKFQLADGGTIFLDEIGDMPLSLQAKILRVLQEREIERIGGRLPISVDVRIIAATHCDLQQMIKMKEFREDLYYRLHVIPIYTPPLREYTEDLPLLADLFISRQAKEIEIEKPRVKPEFLRALAKYHWPGNVREMLNIIEQVMSLSNGLITEEYLPGYILFGRHHELGKEDDRFVLRNQTDELEREAIIKAIETYRGNKLKVSEMLGISRSSLYNKMRKYNLEG